MKYISKSHQIANLTLALEHLRRESRAKSREIKRLTEERDATMDELSRIRLVNINLAAENDRLKMRAEPVFSTPSANECELERKLASANDRINSLKKALEAAKENEKNAIRNGLEAVRERNKLRKELEQMKAERGAGNDC